jgi:predicted small metal-binding protein
VIKIEGVKCPICKERLTGNSTEELNRNLEMHMADLHQMRRMAPSGQSGSYASSPTYPESREEREVTTWSGRERYPESREERAATTWSGKERYEESPEAMRKEEEVTQWRYPRSEEGGRSSMGEARHGGGWGHRMWHRYDQMTMSMQCPLCDSTIRGSDEEDLSDEMRFHFKDAHRDVMRR